jgi:hypothetical protein
MRAAIAIDNWKLPIFKRHLDAAGFDYEELFGVTHDTMFLSVVTEDVDSLAVVVKAANAEAAREKVGGRERQ